MLDWGGRGSKIDAPEPPKRMVRDDEMEQTATMTESSKYHQLLEYAETLSLPEGDYLRVANLMKEIQNNSAVKKLLSINTTSFDTSVKWKTPKTGREFEFKLVSKTTTSYETPMDNRTTWTYSVNGVERPATCPHHIAEKLASLCMLGGGMKDIVVAIEGDVFEYKNFGEFKREQNKREVEECEECEGGEVDADCEHSLNDTYLMTILLDL